MREQVQSYADGGRYGQIFLQREGVAARADRHDIITLACCRLREDGTHDKGHAFTKCKRWGHTTEEILYTNLSWPCSQPTRQMWEDTQPLLQSIDAALDKGFKPHTTPQHMPRFYEILDLLRYQQPAGRIR